ncbi:MAG: hypothetical protein AAF664_03170 [Planctomycetota bacterium]
MNAQLFDSLVVRRILGVGIVAVSLLALISLLAKSETISAASSTIQTIVGGVLPSASKVTLPCEVSSIRAGDPVFLHSIAEAEGSTYRQVGYVLSHSTDDREVKLHLEGIDASAGMTLVAHQQEGSLDEVVATMLPASKREQIRRSLAMFVEREGEIVVAQIQPLIERSLAEAVPIIERSLQESLRANRSELEQIASDLNKSVIDERWRPLAKEEIIPIVRRHAEATATDIGEELWQRASLWRFGWRAAYDGLPLPKRDYVRQEWQRFVDEEAMQVIEDHSDEIVTAVRGTISDLMANQRVRETIGQSLMEVWRHPEAKAVLEKIVRESVIENEELETHLQSVWQSDEARTRLAVISSRMEPVIRKIGDNLFGTREEGIDPGFARVLRSQILGKDRRWIVITTAPTHSTASKIVQAESFEPFPVLRTAQDSRASLDSQ